MASIWRRAMVYLGLVDDEEYDEYEPYPPEPAAAPKPVRRAAVPERSYEPEPPMSVRTLPPREPDSTVQIQRPAVVRPLQPPTQHQKVHTLAPTGFNDAKEIGDRLKNSQPVIVNLQGIDRDLARRLIDFSSGLTYGVGGAMEKVAESVFLLTPSNVEVSAEEKRRLQDRGLYRS
ncbi:MAG TPA: cell division protein SepF [Candidatus Thermoplasmatota archaeon]|nr:cell division protein SepF [Candidatus Thermoplasmatota archaeon]